MIVIKNQITFTGPRERDGEIHSLDLLGHCRIPLLGVLDFVQLSFSIRRHH